MNFIYFRGSLKTIFVDKIVFIQRDEKEPAEFAIIELINGQNVRIRDAKDLQLLAEFCK